MAPWLQHSTLPGWLQLSALWCALSPAQRRALLAALAAGIPLALALALLRSRAHVAQQRSRAAKADFSNFLKRKDVRGSGSAPQAGAGGTSARAGARGPAQRRDPTSFSSFLKVQPTPTQAARRDPTSFSSFLKRPPPARGEGGEAPASAAGSSAPAAEEAARPQAHHILVSVLFATEYGFAKEIAEKACAALRQADTPFWPLLVDAAEQPEGLDLSASQALLVVASTQGDGVPPADARELCDWLAGPAAPALPALPFSVCALGDTSYEHFCACGRALDARLEALGGARAAPRADINREDWPAVDAWLAKAVAALCALPLKTVGETGGGAAALTAAPAAAAGKRWGKSRPYYGTVVAIEGLCTIRSPDDKDTVRVEVDLGDSGLSYSPGDALGIYAHNCPQAVEELLELLRADGGAQVAVPAWHYEEAPDVLARRGEGGTMPLREALAKCYDLRDPKPALLQLLAERAAAAAAAALPDQGRAKPARRSPLRGGMAKAADSASELHGATNSYGAGGDKASQGGVGKAAQGLGQQDECWADCSPSAAEQAARLVALASAPAAEREAWLVPRHVADLLREFPAALPDQDALLPCLRRLEPRLYSISSSQLEHPSRVQVTVAVVRYASLSRPRIGVASTYVAERLRAGGRVAVYVHKNPDFRLPADAATPIIMVGPGTGLAPFRAFMQERLLAAAAAGGAQAKPGPAVLFFGCRRADQDFLYGDLLTGWAAAGHLTLFTAFSREQAGKVYVQQRIRENGTLLWRLLEAGAHFYVCGDAAAMAPAVEAALLDAIQEQQGGDATAAAAYLERLRATTRFQRDVWF